MSFSTSDFEQPPHRALVITFAHSDLSHETHELALIMMESLIWDPQLVYLDAKTSRTAQRQLDSTVKDFLSARKKAKEKLIVYYGGSSFLSAEEEGEKGWRWHAKGDEEKPLCEKHTVSVDPRLALESILHAGHQDVLLIFDCPVSETCLSDLSTPPPNLFPRNPFSFPSESGTGNRNIQILGLPSSADFSYPQPNDALCALPSCANPALLAGKNSTEDREATRALRKTLRRCLKEELKFTASVQEICNGLRGHGYRRGFLVKIAGQAKDFLLARGLEMGGEE